MHTQRLGTGVRRWKRDFYTQPEGGQVPSQAFYVSEGVRLMGLSQALPQGAALDHLGLCLLVLPLEVTSTSAQSVGHF